MINHRAVESVKEKPVSSADPDLSSECFGTLLPLEGWSEQAFLKMQLAARSPRSIRSLVLYQRNSCRRWDSEEIDGVPMHLVASRAGLGGQKQQANWESSKAFSSLNLNIRFSLKFIVHVLDHIQPAIQILGCASSPATSLISFYPTVEITFYPFLGDSCLNKLLSPTHLTVVTPCAI